MILDTNALSGFLRDEPPVIAHLRSAAVACLPVIVLGEYRFGLLTSSQRTALLEKLDACEEAFVVLPIDAVTAHHYAEIRRGLRQKGRPIPENDIWIASLAQQHQMPILSRDEHFDEVSGVTRVAW